MQETTRFTPFRFESEHDVQSMLDAMQPCINEEEFAPDALQIAQRAEEARRLARLHVGQQQDTVACRYNLRDGQLVYKPGEQVWVWTPVSR